MVYIILGMDAITMTMTPIVIAVIVDKERADTKESGILHPRRILPYANRRFILI